MADSAVAITAGSGTNVDTRTEGTNGNHRQVVVVGDPATNAGVAPVDATNGLSVTLTTAVPAGTNAIGKLAANSGVDIGDVDVTSSALPTGASTAANQSTIIGHVDGIETVLGTIDADTSTLAGAVAGTEMQVDVISSALPTGAATAANQQTDALTDTELRATPVPISGSVTADLGANNDVSLNAGTNSIGKVLPTDIDVTAHTNYARKYYTSTTPTDGIIWSPAAGKRWHVVTMYINVSADSTVTLEDDKTGGDDPVWKGEIAAKSGVVLQFPERYPMASGEDAADLTITATAGTVYVTCVGYEV